MVTLCESTAIGYIAKMVYKYLNLGLICLNIGLHVYDKNIYMFNCL